MHVLLTGHTGFKGAWFASLLQASGHDVSGIALDPVPGALFETATVARIMRSDIRLDVRDDARITKAIAELQPDVVVHLAAQPLVRESYRDPRTTFETNVLGTLNVLSAVQATPSVRAQLIVTTDKVYRNTGRAEGYSESEPLGAADPYSTSKAMADLLTQSWVRSSPGSPTAIARGGNVIGGGDHSQDRLLPDLMRGFESGEPVMIRNPAAVRPWQHVLDCLAGYWAIVEALLAGAGTGEWNIGPGAESFVTVGDVATSAAEQWGHGATWVRDDASHPHEAAILALDAGRAARELGVSNALTYPECLEWTVEWHREVSQGAAPRDATTRQIDRYLERTAHG